MERKQSYRKVIVIIVLVITVIATLSIYSRIKKNMLYDDLDRAREECRQNVEASQIYETRSGDHVKDVTVNVLFDDNDLSSSWFHTNLDEVIVDMDEGFEELSMTERCDICYQIMNEIQPRLKECFNISRYYQLYRENSGFSSMRYRNIYLYVYHNVEFKFRSTDHNYTFPSYKDMAVSFGDSRFKDYYEFKVTGGRVVECNPKFGSSTNKTDNKTGTSRQSQQSSISMRPSGNKSYDPYDVFDYESAEEFADDRFDEFFDSEYEDEDEAYDAAVDYWYDNH